MRETASKNLPLAWLALLCVGAVLAPHMLQDPLAIELSNVNSSFQLEHLLGTDELGRDVLSRLLHAARATLLVTAGATLLDMLIATVVGLVAGYRGGWLDRALVVVIDLFWTVPFVVFVVLVISITGVNTLSLIVAIAAINWVTAARVIRAEAVRLRDQPFVRAAQAFGFSPLRVIAQHIFPALGRTLASLTAYTALEVLTLETGLAFIGLSLPAPTPTWGGMLSEGLNYLDSAWWLVFVPAGAITLTLISLQTLARLFENSQLSHDSL